jgi:hypothetical protein
LFMFRLDFQERSYMFGSAAVPGAEHGRGSRHPHHLHQERGRAEFVFEWYGWTSSSVPWLFHSSYFMSYCRTTIGVPLTLFGWDIAPLAP